jgi:hypothetical protein
MMPNRRRGGVDSLADIPRVGTVGRQSGHRTATPPGGSIPILSFATLESVVSPSLFCKDGNEL